jgi:hypothetical protein
MIREENYVDVIESILPDFQTAAESVARKWPQATNPEDLFQDLMIHFLERPGSLESLFNLNQVDRVKRLTAIGHEKASSARDDYALFSGQIAYSVDEVRFLASKGAATKTVPNFEAGSTDFQVALEELRKKNPKYHGVLVRVYVGGEHFDRKSNEAKNVLPRAMESLTTLMNRLNTARRYNHENGSRRRNNRQARVDVELDYLGGDSVE